MVDHTLCGTSGTSVLVKWTCPLGHKGRFWSSRKANGVLVNNLQTSAAILLSGCSFIKVAKMAKFMGLYFVPFQVHLLQGAEALCDSCCNRMMEVATGKDI